MNGRKVASFVQRFGLLIVLAAGVAWAFASGATDQISLAELKDRRVELLEFVDAHQIAAIAFFMALYTVVVALSLPLALVLTLTGGFLFGPIVGALASVTSATAGSTIAYAACRTAFGDLVMRRAGPTVSKLAEGFRRDAFSYLFTLRIIPLAPLLLINVGAGVAGVPMRTFVAASFIGMLPGSFVYAWLGSGLGAIFEQGGEPNLSIMRQPSVFLPLLALAALALVPVIYKRLKPAAREL